MHKLIVYAFTCVTLVVSTSVTRTIVCSCVAVLYWKHEILYDILTYVLEPGVIRGGGGLPFVSPTNVSYL